MTLEVKPPRWRALLSSHVSTCDNNVTTTCLVPLRAVDTCAEGEHPLFFVFVLFLFGDLFLFHLYRSLPPPRAVVRRATAGLRDPFASGGFGVLVPSPAIVQRAMVNPCGSLASGELDMFFIHIFSLPLSITFHHHHLWLLYNVQQRVLVTHSPLVGLRCWVHLRPLYNVQW